MGEWTERDKGTNGISERKKGVRDKDMKEIIPAEFKPSVSASILQNVL
jgi:hypothetical protein